jgi:Protein of unknown function (DUF1353)
MQGNGMRMIFLSAILVISALTFHLAHGQPNFGRFPSPAKLEFIDQGPGKGRDMRLLEDFTYIDPSGGVWTAPKGFQTDGASIPQVFWSFVGAPYEGAYRNAAIIHDWYCGQKDRRWQDVHRTFYYGSRAAEVGEIMGKILYAAVMFGGPRWGTGKSQCYAQCHSPLGITEEGAMTVLSPEVSPKKAQAIIDWINRENPSLEEIGTKSSASHGSAVFD